MNEIVLVLSTISITLWLTYYIERLEVKSEEPKLSSESWKYLKPNTHEYDEYMIFLEDELSRAISRESYGYAAHIRDQINELLCKQNK